MLSNEKRSQASAPVVFAKDSLKQTETKGYSWRLQEWQMSSLQEPKVTDRFDSFTTKKVTKSTIRLTAMISA